MANVLKARQKIRNCSQCGKIFSPIRGEKLCRDCRLKEEELERQVIDYVRDHPGISMKQTTEDTGVSEKIIKRMAREGLFVNMTLGADFVYPCVNCGRPISRGTYCTDCLAKLRKETKKVAEAMHIRARDDKKMSTLEKLNAQAQREFERENRTLRNFSKGMMDMMNK